MYAPNASYGGGTIELCASFSYLLLTCVVPYHPTVPNLFEPYGLFSKEKVS